jgi:hypothetical protein
MMNCQCLLKELIKAAYFLKKKGYEEEKTEELAPSKDFIANFGVSMQLDNNLTKAI